MKRTLSLRKETLAELTAGELASVAGGVTTVGPKCLPETLTFCPDFYCTGTV
ncbi:MAG TPA: class I lanthipeptide [Mycobacteriales bacterium]|jgi:hypothetical protein|nr:class I lanthipeptide [Mycobacteriales bacterium]